MNKIKYYLAPMEGVTDYIYRNAHHTFFVNADKYFTPFITTNQNGTYKPRDITGILPENNQGLTVIPQILTNQADQFLRTAHELQEYGYREINLNLGCPSGTVVAKYKGSGFLAKQDELHSFLETIYAGTSMKISIKTRIGKDEPEEFYDLIKIFNQYPLEELIIHPRIQKDYYKNKPNWEVFGEALSLCKHSICYNGDIFTPADYHKFCEAFSNVGKVMLGRGVIINPGLIAVINGGAMPDKKVLKAFHDKIYTDYRAILYGDKNVLFRMKELWFYMLQLFADSEKYAKKIRKAECLRNYEQVVNEMFEELEIQD